MIVHHPNHEMLLDYASGSLPEGPALLVASHLAFCSLCRDEIRSLESIGGEMLSGADPSALAPDLLDQVMARLDEPEAVPPPPLAVDSETRDILPGPLQRFVGHNLNDLNWRRVTSRIEEAQLPSANPRFKTALLRIQPGTRIPSHTHEGNEYTLVLKGGIREDDTEFRRGDVMAADHEHQHRPMATEDDICICLAVLDAPMRFTGLIGRLINPFVRF